MDEAQTRSAWPPHSYDNIYYIQKYYESAVMSGKMVDQTRPPLVLVHKAQFAYQSPAPACADGSAGHEDQKGITADLTVSSSVVRA
jgi:hypothetical protein